MAFDFGRAGEKNRRNMINFTVFRAMNVDFCVEARIGVYVFLTKPDAIKITSPVTLTIVKGIELNSYLSGVRLQWLFCDCFKSDCKRTS